MAKTPGEIVSTAASSSLIMPEPDIREEPPYEERFQSFLESGVRKENSDIQMGDESHEKTRKLAAKRKARVLQREDMAQFSYYVIRYIENFRMAIESAELGDEFTHNFEEFLRAALTGNRGSALQLAKKLQQEGACADAEEFLARITEFIWQAGTPDAQIPNHAEEESSISSKAIIICSASVIILISAMVIGRYRDGDTPAHNKNGALDEKKQPAGEEELHTQELGADTGIVRQKQSQLAQANLTKLRDSYSNMDPDFWYRGEEIRLECSVDQEGVSPSYETLTEYQKQYVKQYLLQMPPGTKERWTGERIMGNPITWSEYFVQHNDTKN